MNAKKVPGLMVGIFPKSHIAPFPATLPCIGPSSWFLPVAPLLVLPHYLSTRFAAVRYIASGVVLYRLRTVTPYTMTGLVAHAAYIKEPTMERYRALFTG